MILPLIAIMMLQAGPIEVGPASTSPFGITFTGLLSDGSPGAIVTEVEFQFTPAEGPAKRVRLPFVPVVGVNRVSMRLALEGVPPGVYDVRARWYDAAAQPSAFSDPPLAVRNIVLPPAAPSGVTVLGASSDG